MSCARRRLNLAMSWMLPTRVRCKVTMSGGCRHRAITYACMVWRKTMEILQVLAATVRWQHHTSGMPGSSCEFHSSAWDAVVVLPVLHLLLLGILSGRHHRECHGLLQVVGACMEKCRTDIDGTGHAGMHDASHASAALGVVRTLHPESRVTTAGLLHQRPLAVL